MEEINETENNRTSKGFGKWGMLIALILMVGTVSAALLTTYGTFTGTAEVEAGVTIEGESPYVIGDSLAQAGNTYLDGAFTVKNNAENPATITLNTGCANSAESERYPQTEMDIDWSTKTYSEACDGIVTKYSGVLELTTKNTATWNPITDKRVTVVYSLVGDTFEYEITNEEGTGFDIDDYVLIYYKDVEEDQCNPVANRAHGIVKLADDIYESIPHTDDYNNKETANYCGNCYGDTYTHCTGAKLWLVPADEIVDNAMTWDKWDKYLYETDLITYTKGSDNKITLPANGGGFDFVVENALDVALVPDTYTLTTDISPV